MHGRALQTVNPNARPAERAVPRKASAPAPPPGSDAGAGATCATPADRANAAASALHTRISHSGDESHMNMPGCGDGGALRRPAAGDASAARGIQRLLSSTDAAVATLEEQALEGSKMLELVARLQDRLRAQPAGGEDDAMLRTKYDALVLRVQELEQEKDSDDRFARIELEAERATTEDLRAELALCREGSNADPAGVTAALGKAELEQSKADAEKRCSELEQSKADLEQSKADAEKRCSELEQSKADAEKRCSELEQGKADLEQSKADAEKRCSELEHSKADAEKRCSELEHSKADAEKRCSELEQGKADLEQSKADAEKRCSELEQSKADAEPPASDVHWQRRAAELEAETVILRAQLDELCESLDPGSPHSDHAPNTPHSPRTPHTPALRRAGHQSLAQALERERRLAAQIAGSRDDALRQSAARATPRQARRRSMGAPTTPAAQGSGAGASPAVREQSESREAELLASVRELEEDIQAMEAATSAAHQTLKQSLEAVEQCGGEDGGVPSLQLRSAVERVVQALETVMFVEDEEEGQQQQQEEGEEGGGQRERPQGTGRQETEQDSTVSCTK